MTDNVAIDCIAVEVCSSPVAWTKGKRPSTRKVSGVEKTVVKKSKEENKKYSNTNPN